jgi:DNA-binding NarL/FixJ family response regulator
MILCAANFRIVASQTTLDNLRVEALAKYEATLLIVDASDEPGIAARLIAQFKAIYPPGRIAVLGERSGPADILSAFRAGANAYFGRVSTCEALIKALELVMLGETILPAQLSPLLDGYGEAGGPLPTSHESGTTQDLVFPGGIGAQQLSERESCILRDREGSRQGNSSQDSRSKPHPGRHLGAEQHFDHLSGGWYGDDRKRHDNVFWKGVLDSIPEMKGQRAAPSGR